MNVLAEPIQDQTFLRTLIPQKDPFVLVDTLKHFSEDSVISGLTVNTHLLFIQNQHLMAPGVIEHMAQTVALHTGYQYYLKNEPAPTGYIGAIKEVQIHSLPKLGDALTTTVTILHEIMGVTLVKAEVVCNNEIIATGEMKTVLAV